MIDWSMMITLASLVGVVANIYKKSWCFAIWLFTNFAWCIYDFINGLYSQSFLFAIYTGLAVWGLVKWAGDKNAGKEALSIHSDECDKRQESAN